MSTEIVHGRQKAGAAIAASAFKEFFRRFARKSAEVFGSAIAFAAAILIVLLWLLTGPAFHYSDTWQLLINTGTTIVTFLMVFLIQATQNRDSMAIHLKLDELIRSIKPARNSMIDLDQLSDQELSELHAEYLDLCQRRSARCGKATHAAKSDAQD